ncbi:hypothetical protein [Naasia lichenicola]|uniref:PH domain-containing protein n=1 Tax=Naasia lichenicola TaxID=2565933 RepID=A0A4S4FQZ7_9MICO|nr:hypothetical protein [Naasia lichenicola]THG33019.1 hypothetical protein E6C64_01240 [Naasia lichenicola]
MTMHQPAMDQPAMLRPLVGHLSNRYGLSAALLVAPPIIALYALTIPRGTWPYILVLHATITATILLLSRGVRRAKLRITADGIKETGFFGRPVFTPRTDIASTVVVSVTDGNSPTAYKQLFVLDALERTRIRLRGQFWGEDAIEAVVHAFDVPTLRVSEPTTMADLRGTYGDKLYWHERHPIWRAMLMGVAVTVICGPVFWFIGTLTAH